MINSHTLTILSILFFALALVLIAGAFVWRIFLQRKREKSLDILLTLRTMTNQALSNNEDDTKKEKQTFLDKLIVLGTAGVATSIGRQLVAEEDRHLLNTCGINNAQGQALFFIARVVFGLLVPFVSWLIFGQNDFIRTVLAIFIGFAVGYMAPKIVMRKYAAHRCKRASEELPLFIDLLRLLQGVGLSIDQSLLIIDKEFHNILPVLGRELEISSNQYKSGRSREQSLQRFSTVFDNEDLGAVARLIVQVDRYGGAVQEPLKRFSERVRERRRLDMKAEIGKLTVKMTAVMVITLLPALLIITGGVGFLAIFRGLARVGGQG